VTEPVPPPVVWDTDPTMEPGKVRTIEGVPGSRTAHYTVTYKNGTEVSRALVPGSVVVTQPVPTRKITGNRAETPNTVSAPSTGSTNASTGTSSSGSAAAPATSNTAPAGKLTLHVYATWYTAAQGAWPVGSPNWGKTYTGAIVDHGICATDPNVIPMGTHFYVPGYGNCVAADIGGGIKGYAVDLGFPESVGNNAPWNTGYVDITILD
jgi:3D (Asp-Asp-Asp) domain-containing protein